MATPAASTPLQSSSIPASETLNSIFSTAPLVVNAAISTTLMSTTVKSISIHPSGALNTTASSTNKPAPSQGKGGHGLSSGAIAGVVIGCVAAAALAAALIFWFLVRRRKASKHQYAQAGQHAPETHEKGFSLSTISPSDGGVSSIEALPQPLEDEAITGHVSKISNAIKNHVQSYYHNKHTGSRSIDHSDVRALGSDLPLSAEALTSLMENPATREMALRLAIAWAVISRMQPSKDPSKSLLPTEIARHYENTADKPPGSQVPSKLTAPWRALTAELSRSNYVRAPFDTSDSRHANIQALAATLDRILQPYADPQMNNEERKRNLEEVLKRAASFALTLFSQPSTYSFEWQKVQGVTAGDLCIFPALVQLADETGQQVNPPRSFSEAVIRRVDV